MKNEEPLIDLEDAALWCILFVLLMFSLGGCAPIQRHIAHQRDLMAQYQQNQKRFAEQHKALSAQNASYHITTHPPKQ